MEDNITLKNYFRGEITFEELEFFTGIFDIKFVNYVDIPRVVMEFERKGYNMLKCDHKYINHYNKYAVYVKR